MVLTTHRWCRWDPAGRTCCSPSRRRRPRVWGRSCERRLLRSERRGFPAETEPPEAWRCSVRSSPDPADRIGSGPRRRSAHLKMNTNCLLLWKGSVRRDEPCSPFESARECQYPQAICVIWTSDKLLMFLEVSHWKKVFKRDLRFELYKNNEKIKVSWSYRGTRIHSSKLFRPSCPSVPRPQEKTWPLSFRASVWDSPHDTATMIWASSATTCSKTRQGENDSTWPSVLSLKKSRGSPTWFLPAPLVSQLSQIVAAAGVHGPVVQQEGRVLSAAPDVTHSLPVEELASFRLDDNLFVDPSQTELAVGSISPAQHGCPDGSVRNQNTQTLKFMSIFLWIKIHCRT